MTDEQIREIMQSLTVDDMLILYAVLEVLGQERQSDRRFLAEDP